MIYMDKKTFASKTSKLADNQEEIQEFSPKINLDMGLIAHIKSLLGIFPAACGVIWRNEQIYT